MSNPEEMCQIQDYLEIEEEPEVETEKKNIMTEEWNREFEQQMDGRSDIEPEILRVDETGAVVLEDPGEVQKIGEDEIQEEVEKEGVDGDENIEKELEENVDVGEQEEVKLEEQPG